MTKNSAHDDDRHVRSGLGRIPLDIMGDAMKFRKNLGVADRILRLTVSAIVVILFLSELIGGPLAAVLVSLSAVLTITALVGFCPVYRVLGVGHRSASSPDELS